LTVRTEEQYRRRDIAYGCFLFIKVDAFWNMCRGFVADTVARDFPGLFSFLFHNIIVVFVFLPQWVVGVLLALVMTWKRSDWRLRFLAGIGFADFVSMVIYFVESFHATPRTLTIGLHAIFIGSTAYAIASIAAAIWWFVFGRRRFIRSSEATATSI